MTLEERFWAKVEKTDGCWLWTAFCEPHGYGRFWGGELGQLAHRVAYQLTVGPIPEGLTLDHLCRNRGCVNPEHLEPVSSGVNVLRGDTIAARNKAKTHCDSGHEFTPENTYFNPLGHRGCRTCRYLFNQRYYASSSRVAA